MSVVQDIAVRLVAVGLVGTAWMALYLLPCRRADWAMLPAGSRHRAMAWQRRAPAVLHWSASLAALGALLALATLAAGTAG
jgi:hypothetical protein